MNDQSNHDVFLGLDHPALATEDVDTLAAWYVDTLGYERLFRHEKPIWILRAADGTLLEIMPCDETPRPERTNWTPGWSHVAIRVSDFERAQALLDKQGIAWTSKEAAAAGGGRVRSFTDPDGNMIQIVERTNS